MGGTLSTISKVVAPITMLGGAMGTGSGGGDQTPQANQIDPRLQEMQNQQAKTAADYKANLESTRNDQGNAAADSSRAKLANTMQQTKANENSRGLLYGGHAQGALANDQAASQADLNKTVGGINTDTQNNLNNLQNQALTSGIALQGQQNAINQNSYDYQLKQRQMQNQATGGLLGGVGKVFGSVMGGG